MYIYNYIIYNLHLVGLGKLMYIFVHESVCIVN